MEEGETETEIKESFGDFLKRHREARGKSIEDISRVTRISKAFLRAFEENDRELFPDETFTRGFLKSYAIEIGLDTDECLSRYDRFHRSTIPTNIKEVRRPPLRNILVGSEGGHTFSSKWLVWVIGVGVIVGGLLVSVLWWGRDFNLRESLSYDSSSLEEFRTSVETQPSGESAQNAKPSAKAQMLVTPAPPSVLTIRAKRDASLLIRLDEAAQTKVFIKEGEAKTLNVFREIEIRNGDKTAFAFFYNGKPLEISGPVIKLFNRHLFTRK